MTTQHDNEANAEQSIITLFLRETKSSPTWTLLFPAQASAQSVHGCSLKTSKGNFTLSYEVIDGQGDNGERIPFQTELMLTYRSLSGKQTRIRIPDSLSAAAWHILQQAKSVSAQGITL
ncbi:MAG: hypothetical protein ACP5OR_04080 [Candidatus Dormibacteria bacterium]